MLDNKKLKILGYKCLCLSNPCACYSDEDKNLQECKFSEIIAEEFPSITFSYNCSDSVCFKYLVTLGPKEIIDIKKFTKCLIKNKPYLQTIV